VIRDEDLARMKREGMTLADVGVIGRVLGGREPLVVDYERRSPCCNAPVGVFNGRIQNPDGTPYSGGKDWQIPILRRCGQCGEDIPAPPTEPR
jgi:hypothetical protein